MHPETVAEMSKLSGRWKTERDRIHTGETFPVGAKPDGFSWTGFVTSAQGGNGGYVLLFRECSCEQSFSLDLSPYFTASCVEVLSGDGSGRTVGDPANDPFASGNVYMMPGQNNGDPSAPTARSGDWDIQQLSAVMESLKNKPTAEAKQIIADNFGVSADSWEPETSGDKIYHTAKLPKSIKVYQNDFDTIEIIENQATGVIDPNGESVSVYKIYDSYQEAAGAMAWLTGYLTNELGAGSMSMYSEWKTNSGKVTVSIDVATNGRSGVLNLGFRAQ